MKGSPTVIALFQFFFVVVIINVGTFPANGKTRLPVVHDEASHQIYIVHVVKPTGKEFHLFKRRKEWYMSYLPNVTLASGWPRLVYAYRQVITGFAAWLSQEEVSIMKTMDGFLFAHQDDVLQPRTTYTYKYLGLKSDDGQGLWYNSDYGTGQIIGVVDTGLRPGHLSFEDEGIPPPDGSKWKGECYWGPPICNNKLIGAQGFSQGTSIPPLDRRGHGTAVASVAAGNVVQDVSISGNERGTASGMAPKAHLAIYKITTSADLLRCIDQAIRDHVDVLSISQGSGRAFIYNQIVIGSFAASTKGIVTCAATSNNGPDKSLVDNDAPWIITVGACTTDRRITSVVKLGDGQEFFGESLWQETGYATPQLPLLNIDECSEDVEKHDIVGKIVMCDNTLNTWRIGETIRKAGGLAMIAISPEGNTTKVESNVIPSSQITSDDGKKIKEYFSSSPNPTAAIIFRGTEFGIKPAPAVARFSGRGPSLQNGGIIKPDIVAPGVNIFAALSGGNKTAHFYFRSGTSLATPHVAGIAALLKHNHPMWSPAAIQSAIMTTAESRANDGNPIKDQSGGKNAGVFDMGSGMVSPVAANNPGLIYDIKPHDYIRYLCGSGLFSDDDVSAIIRGNISCSNIRGIKPEELNYPSIGVTLSANSPTVTVKRTVTNVGEAEDVYKLYFDDPKGVRLDVSPQILSFKAVGETKSYNVTISFKTIPMQPGDYSEGQLGWVSGKYLVRSPIAVTFV